MVRREVEKRLENPFTSAKTRFIARLVEEISNILSRSKNTQVAVETHFPHQKYEILTQALTVIEEFLAKVENRKLPRSAQGSNLESRLSTLILKLQSLKTDFQLALQILNTNIGDAYFTSEQAKLALNPVYARIIAVLILLGLLGATESTAFAYTTEKASVVESAYPDDALDSEDIFTDEDFESLRELLANARKIAENILASADFNPEQVVAGPGEEIDPQPTIDTVSLTGQTYTVGVASLNARSGPGTENSILGAVTNGQSFEILNESNGTNYTWYQIRLGDELVWIADVNNSGIVSESEPIQTEVYKLVPQITTILDETPLRPSNSRDSGFITSLPAGTQVEVIGVEAGDTVPPTWIQVTYTTSSGQEVSGFVTDHVLDLQKVDLEAWEANEQPTQFVPESPPTTFPTPEAMGDTQNLEPEITVTPNSSQNELVRAINEPGLVTVSGILDIEPPVILLTANGARESGSELISLLTGFDSESIDQVLNYINEASSQGEVVLASIDENNVLKALYKLSEYSNNENSLREVIMFSVTENGIESNKYLMHNQEAIEEGISVQNELIRIFDGNIPISIIADSSFTPDGNPVESIDISIQVQENLIRFFERYARGLETKISAVNVQIYDNSFQEEYYSYMTQNDRNVLGCHFQYHPDSREIDVNLILDDQTRSKFNLEYLTTIGVAACLHWITPVNLDSSPNIDLNNPQPLQFELADPDMLRNLYRAIFVENNSANPIQFGS